MDERTLVGRWSTLRIKQLEEKHVLKELIHLLLYSIDNMLYTDKVQQDFMLIIYLDFALKMILFTIVGGSTNSAFLVSIQNEFMITIIMIII